MATTARICLKRGPGSDWTSTNYQLLNGELGIDTTKGYIKMGDGTQGWNGLKYLYQDLIDGLASSIEMLAKMTGLDGVTGIVGSQANIAGSFPNPNTGDVVLVLDENKFYKYDGSAWVPVTTPAIGSGTLSPNEIEDLVQAKYDSFGHVGQSYTIDSFNEYDKATHITYEDGTVIDFTWDETVLVSALCTYTDGSTDTMTYNYDSNKRFIGQTRTHTAAS